MGFIVLLNALLIIIVNICSLPTVNYQLTLQKFVRICGLLFDTQNVEFLQSIRIVWSSDYAILATLTSLSMLLFVTLAVSGIFSINLLPFELLLFLPSQWLPVLNPLITIITVHKYRIGFKKMFGLKTFQENSNKQTPIVLPMVQTNNENIIVQERCITPLGRNLCQIDRTYN
uniref:G_PROTEIN_RECEP_F1_2 domain-containing protein n=1 Tax=Meloidogyne hapla TaxID=6305 RepID=A0A1I8BDK4_MELHA